MTGHQLHFYATREDLEPMIRGVESVASFRYSLCGLHASRKYPEYASALAIPSLGRATADSAVNCDAYLVVSAEDEVAIREVQQITGGVRFAVDQLVNPRSIVFQAGGVRNGGVMIHGRISTTGQSDEADAMFRLFSRWLKKGFERRKAFWVGAAAMRLKQEGFRLTMAEQSPRAYDLA